MSVKMKFGSKDIPFVYKGDKLVYPNPIKDGLLLWYDFKGMKNTDTNKEVAKDLSGNGNDGTLTNFNFTEGSGYKDNTLVFDGVDDSLTIPELVLDETAMTVMHDGKIYSYEDDKVMTVGEGGEIVGNGKNLIKNSSKQVENSNYSLTHYYWSSTKDIIPGERYTVVVKGYLSSPEQNGWYVNIYGRTEEGVSVYPRVSTLLERDKVSDNTWIKTVTIPISLKNPTGMMTLYSNVPGNGFSSKVTHFAVYKGEKVAIGHSHAPEDYQTKSLSLPSLSNLQLYNRPLRKNELLHNAESKGLKKLKDGVPVQDGLVLHYDFSHESNTSEYKDKAFDYSGNGNHGVLNNFNFTEESGYVSEGLKFDGVDDYIGESVSRIVLLDSYQETISFVAKVNENKRNNILYAQENLKIDLRGNSLSRADVTPSISLSYDFLDKIVSVIMVKTETNIKTFINGELLGDASITNSSSTQLSSIGYYIPNGRPNINLYDVKIYNRTLSPEEIAHNYAIEKEKFDIIEGEM